MDSGGLSDYMNRPGDCVGDRRVRRLGRVAPGAVALELWDGERWIVDGFTTDDTAIREWIISHHRADTVTPWTPGTGRRRRPAPDNPAGGRQSA